uniref:RNase H type-1 domain-containing protein n=1 Tax=Cannabis sativa TaxID=3483 RepID=A0A803PY89_CANSA
MPNCLMARILKALYFPHDTFLEANIGHFGSSVWRSILWGREVLMKGSRWCVGDGSSIRINEDHWLPRGTPFSLRSKVSLPEGVTIDKLLTEDGTWKTAEVCSWFHVDDIPWVLGITPITSRSDWFTWSLTNHGQYTVASGYKLRFTHLDIVECSNKSTLKAWWKFVWGSKLTPKMKNFIWRVFNQWLPTKVELTKQVMQSRPEQDVRPKRSWQPPPPDHVLINIDASVVQDKPGCGLSAIIRDHNGQLIVAESLFIPGMLSIQLAEAYAIRMGLLLAQKWSLKKVHVSADCLGVVSALQASPTSLSDWGMIIQEILMLQKHFTFVQFSFVHRECYAVANALAIWNRKTQSCNLWTIDLPDCAATLLLVEKPLVAV